MPEEGTSQPGEQPSLDDQLKLARIEKLRLEIADLRTPWWKRAPTFGFYGAILATVVAILGIFYGEYSRRQDVAKGAIHDFIERQIERLRDANTRESAAMLLRDQKDAYDLLISKYQRSRDDSLRAGIIFALLYLDVNVEFLARRALQDNNPRVAHYACLALLKRGDTTALDGFLEKQRSKQRIKDDGEMVLIPSGSFWIGDDQGEFQEQPKHLVYVKAFYIDKHEVTNTHFEKFVQDTGYQSEGNWQKGYTSDTRDHPVVNVSWNDAVAYAQWAGRRLPTEAEWEKAARGGLIGKKYPWGDSLFHEMANFAGVSGKDKWLQTAPVRGFGANGFGLFDMAGNVAEWVADWYEETYYRHSLTENPKGPNSGIYRVLRGGSCYDFIPSQLRCAYRSRDIPNKFYAYWGFRCAKD